MIKFENLLKDTNYNVMNSKYNLLMKRSITS